MTSLNALLLPSRRRAAQATRLLCAAAALMAGHAAFAQGAVDTAVDSGEQAYRCSVLGQRDACAAREAAQSQPRPGQPYVEDRLELGPYTRYQLSLGTDLDRAVALGRAYGEEPSWRRVRVTPPVLDDQARYQEVVKGDGPSDKVETLSRTAAAQDDINGPDHRIVQ